MNRSFLIIIVLVFICGCAGTAANRGQAVRIQGPGESRKDVESAMARVLGTMTEKPVSEKDLENLGQDIQKDSAARSAVETITNSVTGRGDTVKYCPVDGERYSPKFTTCPVHHVPLKSLSD